MNPDFDKYFQRFRPKLFRTVILGIGLLLIIFLAFGAGVFVGYRKAKFSYAWGENYDRNFGGPHHGIFGIIHERGLGGGFMNAHGTSGSVLSVASSTLTVSGRDGAEKIILVSSSTAIRAGSSNLSIADLKINDSVVVVGSPNNQGQIEARLIRVLPSSKWGF